MPNVPGVDVVATPPAEHAWVLSDEALTLVRDLQRTFGPRRDELLARRAERARELAAGAVPGYLPETADVRAGDWQVAPAPADLNDRRCEITGPAEPKMTINALNCGARVFMADLEDALSPTWGNEVTGQATLHAAHRRTLAFTSPEGKDYRLNDEIATLVVRPRGWHLVERHVLVDGEPVSASLFDFGLHLFHNGRELVDRGSGPYYYLPKLESHLEARLWNDVFVLAQERVGIARGTIRATVLIETILAAFEMEEILYELREHAAGLNAGRWDYIFSLIKKLGLREDALLPDRAQVTMAVPFMRAYAQQLVRACHRHGAHAIGGMAAFIPSRRDAEVNAVALQKVTEDKEREAGDGFDGTWVAHPDLVPVATAVFDRVLGDRPNQKERLRDDVPLDGAALIDLHVPDGKITEAGLRNNVSVGLQYVAAWLGGLGAVAIYNLMEDAATAEISRAQLWQWVHAGVQLDDGRVVTDELYRQVRDDELARLGDGVPHLAEAAELLDRLVEADEFREFLTVPAYALLGVGVVLGGIGIRAAARLARDVFRDRVTLLGNQEAYFVELATAVQTLLVGTRTGRLALSSYRWSMRIVLAVGVALVLIGLAIALPLHTHHSAIVVGALFAILGLFVGWRWWAWSAGLRLLKAYADPTRTVSLTELPGRLKALAAEGEGLAEVSGPVVRDLRALAAWAGRIVDRGDKPKD